MKKISPEYRQFVRENAPWFIEAVTSNHRNSRSQSAPLLTTLDAFEEDPFLLFSALWYAATEGVTVTITPK